MRFALVVPQFAHPKTGGVGPHARKLGEALVAHGDSVIILSEGGVGSRDGRFAVRSIGRTWGFTAALRVLYKLWKSRTEVVLLEYTSFNFGPRSFAPMVIATIARVFKIRVGTYVHESFYQIGSGAVRSAAKALFLEIRDILMIKCSERIFVANESKKQRVLSAARLVNADKIVILPIGANIEPGAREDWRPELADPTIIMSFGVVMPRRRFELIIMALAKLVTEGRDVHLRLVGNIFDRAYAARCLEVAASYGISERVTLTGALDDSLVSAEFRRAVVCAYALEDGVISSSGSLLAAFAHGTPIVATRSPFDESDLAACTLQAATEDGFADAIATVLDDAKVRSTLAVSGRSLYHERYEWLKIASTLRQFYV